MIVVADSSPLIVLFGLGQIDVLPKLFGQVLIPPAVSLELINHRRSEAARQYFAIGAPWLLIQQPVNTRAIPGLHAGETEAINLTIELHAELLLVDERRAFREAVSRKINAVGTVKVLELAADQKLLDLADAFARLKKIDFWISHHLLDQRLKLYLAGKGKKS